LFGCYEANPMHCWIIPS